MAVVPETPVDPEEEPVVGSDVPSSEGEESYDEEVDTEIESTDEAPVEAGGVKAFASAFKTIVTRDLGKAEKEPTLAEDKGVVDKIEEEKEEAKIRKRLAAHRKSLRTAFHVTEPPVLELPLEREYRRIATKGVVAVFNAVKDFRAPEPEVGEEDEDEGEEVVEKEVPSTRSSGLWSHEGLLVSRIEVLLRLAVSSARSRVCGSLATPTFSRASSSTAPRLVSRLDTASKSKFLKLLKKGTKETPTEEKIDEAIVEEEVEEAPQRKKKYRKTRADLAAVSEGD